LEPLQTISVNHRSANALRLSAKESIVTKRVLFGELFPFAEFRPTTGLTQDADRDSSRRFRFSAVI
jgi:hypothetical protein